MNKKKLAAFCRRWWGFLAAAAFGAACGFAAGALGIDIGEDLFQPWMGLAVLLSAAISLFLHIILHEGGHLVCGLLSGYRFVSFRAGSIVLVRQKDGFRLKSFSIPGTGGQCLLDPPEPEGDGRYPCVLYNLGGGLANVLFSILALAGVCFWKESAMAKAVLIPFAVVGVYLAVTNLLPLKLGGVANDGYNIKSFRENPESARALWVQLRVNRLQQTDGLRLSEMPAEYFDIQEGACADPLIDGLRLFQFQRLEDEGRFVEARACGAALLERKGLLAIYRNMLQAELLFLELTGPCRPEEVDRLYTPELKKYLKLVKGYPSTHRLLCAYAARFSCDEAAAERERAAFEKQLAKYPTPGEIRTERILMEEI